MISFSVKKKLRELYKHNIAFKRIYEKLADIRLCTTKKMSDEAFIRMKYKEGTGKDIDF